MYCIIINITHNISKWRYSFNCGNQLISVNWKFNNWWLMKGQKDVHYLLNGYLAFQNSNFINRPLDCSKSFSMIPITYRPVFNKKGLVLPLQFTFYSTGWETKWSYMIFSILEGSFILDLPNFCHILAFHVVASINLPQNCVSCLDVFRILLIFWFSSVGSKNCIMTNLSSLHFGNTFVTFEERWEKQESGSKKRENGTSR